MRHYHHPVCECAATNLCRNYEAGVSQKICLTNGVTGDIRAVVLSTHRGQFILRSTQCIHPSIHVDRALKLPASISHQMSDLLNRLCYSFNPRLAHENITEARQCICMGTVT